MIFANGKYCFIWLKYKTPAMSDCDGATGAIYNIAVGREL